MGAVTSTILGVSSVVAGGISAYGQVQQGRDTEDMYDSNARVAEEEAEIIRQGSILRSVQARKQKDIVVGSQIAGYAGAGVEMTGSPLDVIRDSVANAELDIAVDEYNTEIQAKNKESQAQMYRYYGDEARKSGYMNAATTLLQTASTAAMRASNMTGKTKLGSGFVQDAVQGAVQGGTLKYLPG